MKLSHRAIRALTVGSVALFAVTACSNDDVSTTEKANETGTIELNEVSISGPLVPPNAAIQLAEQTKIFEDNGLVVEFDRGVTTSSQTPALMSGQTDFALCDPGSTLTGAAQGLDIRIIAGFSVTTADAPDNNAVVVRSHERLESFVDLESHALSVDTFRSQGETMIREAITLDGGDVEKVEFSEINFPEMIPQLKQGNTDAVWLPDPFLTIASQDPELEVLGYPFHEVQPETPIEVVCTSGEFADANPEVVDQMQSAIEQLTDYANDHEEELRATVSQFIDIDEELAQITGIDRYESTVPVEKLQTLSDLMLQNGYLAKGVEVEQIVMD